MITLADLYWKLFELELFFDTSVDLAPDDMKEDVQSMRDLLAKRMDYGEHPATYLAAMLDPRCAKREHSFELHVCSSICFFYVHLIAAKNAHARYHDRLDMLPENAVFKAEQELGRLASSDGQGKDLTSQLTLRDFKNVWVKGGIFSKDTMGLAVRLVSECQLPICSAFTECQSCIRLLQPVQVSPSITADPVQWWKDYGGRLKRVQVKFVESSTFNCQSVHTSAQLMKCCENEHPTTLL